MKKLILSITVVFIFVIYNLLRQQNNSQISNNIPITFPNPTSGNQMTNGSFKNGQYTGDVVNAFYGNIQVQATITNGKISNIQFLQYPNDRRNSIAINTQAMPILQQEAIQAQSNQVDIVSGATDTSQAFIQSLASALNQAK